MARGSTRSSERKGKRVWQTGAQGSGEAKMLKGSSYGYKGLCTLNMSKHTIQDDILLRKAAVVSNVKLLWPESPPLENREQKGKTRLFTRAKQSWCRHSKNRPKHLQPVGGSQPFVRLLMTLASCRTISQTDPPEQTGTPTRTACLIRGFWSISCLLVKRLISI